MKRPILVASCVLIMYAVSFADTEKTSPAHSANALNQLINLTLDRKTPLQTESGPLFANKPNFYTPFADSPIRKDKTVADTHDSNVNTTEKAYSIHASGLLIFTSLGIVSIGCLHRKKRL